MNKGMKTVDKWQSTLLLNIVVCRVTTEVYRVKILKTVSTSGYNATRNFGVVRQVVCYC